MPPFGRDPQKVLFAIVQCVLTSPRLVSRSFPLSSSSNNQPFFRVGPSLVVCGIEWKPCDWKHIKKYEMRESIQIHKLCRKWSNTAWQLLLSGLSLSLPSNSCSRLSIGEEFYEKEKFNLQIYIRRRCTHEISQEAWEGKEQENCNIETWESRREEKGRKWSEHPNYYNRPLTVRVGVVSIP